MLLKLWTTSTFTVTDMDFIPAAILSHSRVTISLQIFCVIGRQISIVYKNGNIPNSISFLRIFSTSDIPSHWQWNTEPIASRGKNKRKWKVRTEIKKIVLAGTLASLWKDYYKSKVSYKFGNESNSAFDRKENMKTSNDNNIDKKNLTKFINVIQSRQIWSQH